MCVCVCVCMYISMSVHLCVFDRNVYCMCTYMCIYVLCVVALWLVGSLATIEGCLNNCRFTWFVVSFYSFHSLKLLETILSRNACQLSRAGHMWHVCKGLRTLPTTICTSSRVLCLILRHVLMSCSSFPCGFFQGIWQAPIVITTLHCVSSKKDVCAWFIFCFALLTVHSFAYLSYSVTVDFKNYSIVHGKIVYYLWIFQGCFLFISKSRKADMTGLFARYRIEFLTLGSVIFDVGLCCF